jgi:hypothetical protein
MAHLSFRRDEPAGVIASPSGRAPQADAVIDVIDRVYKGWRL